MDYGTFEHAVFPKTSLGIKTLPPCYGHTLRVSAMLNGIPYNVHVHQGAWHSKFWSTFIVAGIKISELLAQKSHHRLSVTSTILVFCA